MSKHKNKYEYYEHIKAVLTTHKFVVNPYREINYGLQFIVFFEKQDGLLRIYESKKGIRLDYSQVKLEPFKQHIQELLDTPDSPPKKFKFLSDVFTDENPTPDKDPDTLIGVDESGKGDYFGPLVVAAVHISPKTSPILEELDIKDSKVLTDSKIREIGPLIQETCHHSILSLGNDSYNEVYEKMANLNHILAWGHGKVIESVLKQTPCDYALSDQFGHDSLIKSALRSKGIKITLFQRPKAESNLAVAAASILARYTFITELKKLEDHFNITLPKGCSDKTFQAAVNFVKKHSREQLPIVAKLHFVLTKKVDKEIQL